jgi:hypothetical protein
MNILYLKNHIRRLIAAGSSSLLELFAIAALIAIGYTVFGYLAFQATRLFIMPAIEEITRGL